MAVAVANELRARATLSVGPGGQRRCTTITCVPSIAARVRASLESVMARSCAVRPSSSARARRRQPVRSRSHSPCVVATASALPASLTDCPAGHGTPRASADQTGDASPAPATRQSRPARATISPRAPQPRGVIAPGPSACTDAGSRRHRCRVLGPANSDVPCTRAPVGSAVCPARNPSAAHVGSATGHVTATTPAQVSAAPTKRHCPSGLRGAMASTEPASPGAKPRVARSTRPVTGP